MIAETVLGGAVGGLFRLAPEVLKWLDRKNERGHELAMFQKQLDADKLRAELAMQQTQLEGQIVLDGKGLDAFTEAVRGQAAMAAAAGGWVAALSASVRPVLTYYWCIGLYTAALTAQFVTLLHGGAAAVDAILSLWGPDEKAIVASMITFWFLDRVMKHQGG